mmetsp:Transcript_21255/g.50382  ORF Transcript_21255/g.50382 Transcript_21255/m.50382 type:complete len:83 (-) Transcript_21255:159-407(-)
MQALAPSLGHRRRPWTWEVAMGGCTVARTALSGQRQHGGRSSCRRCADKGVATLLPTRVTSSLTLSMAVHKTEPSLLLPAPR